MSDTVRTDTGNTHPSMGEDELQLLERLSALITSIESPERVLEALMDLFLAAMQAERGLVLTFDDNGRATPLVIRNFDSDAVSGVAGSWSRSAIDEMSGGGQLVVSQDVLADDRFRNAESVYDNQIRSLLCLPIEVEGKTQGALYVDHRRSSRTFSDRDMAFAKALADLSGAALGRSQALASLHAENDELRASAGRYQFKDLIGTSDAMQRMFEILQSILIAPAEFAILLTGEHGTGKTQVAKLLHKESDRRDRPFVPFSPGAVPETLIESELFGHVRGAFTGADSDREGLLAQADGGTLLLDDIDQLPATVQPKLLTFLQERQYRPIGAKQPRTADLRVIGATNADLEAKVAGGEFRKDLFYRMNTFTVEIPPLRERKEDILLLARHFLGRYGQAVEKELRGFDEGAMSAMMAYGWPGNVRELMSEVVFAVTMCKTARIKASNFKSVSLRAAVAGRDEVDTDELNLEAALAATTSRIVRRALEGNDDNISHAARAIGVSRGKFYDLMGRAGIRLENVRRGRPPKSRSSRRA